MAGVEVKRILITGAGGFIGHAMTTMLQERGYWLRGADLRAPEFAPSAAQEFMLCDLRELTACKQAADGIDEIYHFASNMGGIGFIEQNRAEIVFDNTVIDMHVLEAARQAKVKKLFYASSACVYPSHLQSQPDLAPLKESDVYPASPEDGYGWEKLYTERACRHYREDYGLETRVARFHNIFGPLGTYDGGREKSPAAICRKIALAQDVDNIEIWGDGEQTRSYCHIADCVDAIYRLMESEHHEPINIGQNRMVTINELVRIVATAANKRITTTHDLDAPLGVRGRNSDNTLVEEVLGWSPAVSLEDGLASTYRWIEVQLRASGRL